MHHTMKLCVMRPDHLSCDHENTLGFPAGLDDPYLRQTARFLQDFDQEEKQW